MTEPTAARAERETLGFQTEVRQLLQLMIHSLYSNREIFLRELISNASDACDKLRFEALHNEALFEDDFELAIRIDYDPAARTLSVADNGVGMSRDEVITQPRHDREVGHAGVLLATHGRPAEGRPPDRAVRRRLLFVVHRRGQGDRPHAPRRREARPGRAAGNPTAAANSPSRWRRSPPAAPRSRCTCAKARTTCSPGPSCARSSASTPTTSSSRSGCRRRSGRTASSRRSRARRPSTRRPRCGRGGKGDISDEQYKEFYKHVGHDFDDPLAWSHARVEGRQEYTHLLYVPSRAPFDLWDRNARHGIKLYVRRVFIMDDAEQLLPAYLRFVRGVVDSNDLPLNISREILQESKDIEAIRGGCTRKVLGLLEELADERQGEVRADSGVPSATC